MLKKKYLASPVILLLLFLWIAKSVPAQSEDPVADNLLLLRDQVGSYPLGLHFDILEDPSGLLTIDQVASPQMAALFSPSAEKTLSYGITSSTIWARLFIEDQSLAIPAWLMEFRNATLEYIDLYLPTPDGAFELHPSGLLVPDSEQEFPDNHYVFEIPPGLQSDQPIYLRFSTANSMTIPATLWSPGAFSQTERNEELLWGAYFGILLIMALYNLLLFFSLRDRDYLFLSIYILAVFLQTAFIDGRLKDFLPADLGYQYHYLYPLFAIPSLPALLLFSTSFLRTKAFSPRLHKATLILFALVGILVILIFALNRYLGGILFNVISLAMLGVIIASGLVAWRKKYRPARYFLLALLVPLLLGLGEPLSRLGLLPVIPLLYETAHFGDVLLVTILSLALADRINYYRSQTDAAYETVRQREQLITDYLDALPIGVSVYGPDLKPNFVNRTALDTLHLSDYDPANTLEDSLQYTKIFHSGEETPAPVEDLPVYQALQGNTSQRDDLELETNGRRIPLEIAARPIMDSHGEIQYAISAFQDISLRKEQEAAVRIARELYQSVVEKEALLICRFTADGTLTFVNHAYCEFFNALRQDLLGSNVLKAIYPPGQAVAQSELAKIRPESATRLIEVQALDRRSELRWLRWSTQGFFDDKGHLIEYQATGADITAQKEIEEQLANYRENLEILVAERTSQERRQRAIAESLQLSASVLTSDLNLDNVLSKILEQLPEVIQLDRAAIFLLEGDTLVLSNATDRSDQFNNLSISLVNDHYPLVKVFHERASLYFGDTECEPGWSDWETGASIRSWMGTPLQSGDDVVGILSVSSTAPYLYDQNSLPVLEAFANHAAIAIVNARLYQESHTAAVLEERNRLARDLHDAVTQTLFSASIITQALPLQWEQDEAGARANLRRLHQLTSSALAEMRILLLELRPDSMQQISLATLLKNLCEANQSTYNFQVSLQFEESDSALPIDVKEIFYRIAQEALNNVSKHSKASHVAVLLNQTEAGVVLKIQDNGIGFDSHVVPPGHLGLQIMRERAAAIEAKLQVESRPGEGTRLILEWRRKP